MGRGGQIENGRTRLVSIRKVETRFLWKFLAFSAQRFGFKCRGATRSRGTSTRLHRICILNPSGSSQEGQLSINKNSQARAHEKENPKNHSPRLKFVGTQSRARYVVVRGQKFLAYASQFFLAAKIPPRCAPTRALLVLSVERAASRASPTAEIVPKLCTVQIDRIHMRRQNYYGPVLFSVRRRELCECPHQVRHLIFAISR